MCLKNKKRCTVYYVFVKKKNAESQIKLFYILTVKTIKDIYIMNLKSGVDYFCVGVALHCCHAVFFFINTVKNIIFHMVI